MEQHRNEKDNCKFVLYGFGRIMTYANWYSENNDSTILNMIKKEAVSMKGLYGEDPVKYVNQFLRENDSDRRMPKGFNILLDKAIKKEQITNVSKKELKRLGKHFYKTLIAVDSV